MIAIHYNEESFAKGWIEYCVQKKIPHKIVNCFDNNIIEQLRGCDGLMWHYHNANLYDSILARQLLFALEHSGILVFPDFKTSWHFDDKLAQKYLFEQLSLPSVKSYSFFDKKKALDWVEHTSFPKVFKLRKGAASHNVQLVTSKQQAKKLINHSFGRGHAIYKPITILFDRFRKYQRKQEPFLGIIKSIVRLFYWPEYFRYAPKEVGYVYFQDYIPENNSDIRVIIIGDKAFFIRRGNRPNDFRASGGGLITYDHDAQVIACVQEAFKINNKICAQSVAFDFLIDAENRPIFVEISYGFEVPAYERCSGYWDLNMQWFPEKPNFHDWMVEDFIRRCKLKINEITQ